jgi:hypothetical protein
MTPASPVAVVFADTVLRRFLFGVVLLMTVVVCGVAAGAFYTSFEAIRSFAERSGGINPHHAWLAPLLVDSFIFVASAADLWCAATGSARVGERWWQRAVGWLPKALLALAAGGSFALNIAHAPDRLGARVVAALAPAALVLTFEILLLIVRRAVAARVTRLSAQHAVSAQPAPTTVATAQRPPLSPPDGERPSVQSMRAAGRRQDAAAAERLVEVRRLYLDGVMVAEEIARRLQLPPSTTRRLLGKVKRELAARASVHSARPAGEHPVDERHAAVVGERHTATDGECPPGVDGDGERSTATAADGRSAERAVLALTHQREVRG